MIEIDITERQEIDRRGLWIGSRPRLSTFERKAKSEKCKASV